MVEDKYISEEEISEVYSTFEISIFWKENYEDISKDENMSRV